MRILLLKLVDGDGIRDCLNETTCWTSGYNVEWFEPEFKLVSFENSLEFLD